MAGKVARFYRARVVKQGSRLDQDALVHALRDPVTIHHGDFYYTFTDIEEVIVADRRCIVGRLAKYLPEGEAGVVDTERHEATSTFVANFLRAASRFVYVPDVSVLAYEHYGTRSRTPASRKCFRCSFARSIATFLCSAR